MTALTLYGYFRSSTSYRVRIALNLKGVEYSQHPVHLLRGGGEQKSQAYRDINPQMRVPSLGVQATGSQTFLIQSPAIIEWLEETYPTPALLPADLLARARCREISSIIACDIHPLNNLGTLERLKKDFGAGQAEVESWYRGWVEEGFTAIEALLGEGPFCVGNTPTLADVYLVPQIFNARRYKVDLSPFRRILEVEKSCSAIDAFRKAEPGEQPDALDA